MKTFQKAFVPNNISRQRKRTEDVAVDFFKQHTKRSDEEQVSYIKQIRGVKQPFREARKLVAEEQASRDSRLRGSDVWFEQVNPVTWKLTDGVMTEQEGRLDTPTPRGLVWIAGIGWTMDRVVGLPGGRSERRNATVPTGYKVYRRTSYGTQTVIRDTLAEAKQAAIVMYNGGNPESHSSIDFTERKVPPSGEVLWSHTDLIGGSSRQESRNS